MIKDFNKRLAKVVATITLASMVGGPTVSKAEKVETLDNNYLVALETQLLEENLKKLESQELKDLVSKIDGQFIKVDSLIASIDKDRLSEEVRDKYESALSEYEELKSEWGENLKDDVVVIIKCVEKVEKAEESSTEINIEEAKESLNSIDEEVYAKVYTQLKDRIAALEGLYDTVDSEKEKIIEEKLESLEGKTIEEKDTILKEIDKIVEGMSREPKEEINKSIADAKDALEKEAQNIIDRINALPEDIEGLLEKREEAYELKDLFYGLTDDQKRDNEDAQIKLGKALDTLREHDQLFNIAKDFEARLYDEMKTPTINGLESLIKEYNDEMDKHAKQYINEEKVFEAYDKLKELKDNEETEAVRDYEKAIIEAETLEDVDNLREKVNSDERLSEEVKEDLNESLNNKKELILKEVYEEDAERFNLKVQDQLNDFDLKESLDMIDYFNNDMPKYGKDFVNLEELKKLEEKVKIALKDDEETEAVREYEKAIIDAETLEDVDNLREKVNSDERLSEEVKEDLNESLNNKKELILKEVYEEDAERFNLKVQDQLNDFDLKESLDMIDYFNNDMPKYGKDFVNLEELKKLEEKVKLALKDDKETEAIREYEKAIIDAETLNDLDELREKVNQDERLSEEAKEDLNESLDIKEEILRNDHFDNIYKEDANRFNAKVQDQLEDFNLDHSLEMLNYYNDHMPKPAKELVNMEKLLELEVKIKEGLKDREETEAIRAYEKAIIDAETLNDLDELREKVNQDERLSEEAKEDLNESLDVKEESIRNEHLNNIYKQEAEGFDEKVQEELKYMDLDHSLEMIEYFNNDMPKPAKELVNLEELMKLEDKVKKVQNSLAYISKNYITDRSIEFNKEYLTKSNDILSLVNKDSESFVVVKINKYIESKRDLDVEINGKKLNFEKQGLLKPYIAFVGESKFVIPLENNNIKNIKFNMDDYNIVDDNLEVYSVTKSSKSGNRKIRLQADIDAGKDLVYSFNFKHDSDAALDEEEVAKKEQLRKDIIKMFNEVKEEDEERYTEKSFEYFDGVRGDAEGLLEKIETEDSLDYSKINNVTVEELEEMKDKLAVAIDQLVFVSNSGDIELEKPEGEDNDREVEKLEIANKEQLRKDIIKMFNEVKEEDEEKYTEKSFEYFDGVRGDAEGLLEKIETEDSLDYSKINNVTVEELEEMKDKLAVAIDQLVFVSNSGDIELEKPEGEDNDREVEKLEIANKEQLRKDIIKMFNEVKEEDEEKYTEKSFEYFDGVRGDAEGLLEKIETEDSLDYSKINNVTVKELEEMRDNLSDAIKQLVGLDDSKAIQTMEMIEELKSLTEDLGDTL